MGTERKAAETEATVYILPRYLRYARTLALVSGAAVGVAAGAAIISSTVSCTCAGTPCGGPIVGIPARHTDGAADVAETRPVAGSGPILDAAANDAESDANSLPDADIGGGPLPAPLLPRAWIA